MAHSANTYRKIHQLISENIPYRTIAEQLNINKNTIQSVSNRFKETGSIYPSNLKINLYDEYFQTILKRTEHYMLQTKPSYKKYHRVPLRKDEIFQYIKYEFPTISTSNFLYLYRLIKNKKRESFLSIHHTPADVLQFDWGYLTMNVNNYNQKVFFAVFVHPYSLMQFGIVTDKENAEHFHHVFQKYLNRVNSISHQLVIDNMKIAKKTYDPTIKEKNLTRFFDELSRYYNFDIRFCAPNQPNQKGSVELGVKAAKNIIIKGKVTEFESLDHIQALIDQGFNKINAKKHPNKNNTRMALFKEEQSLMKSLPTKPFTFFHYETRKIVKKTSLISLHATFYEMPEHYRGEKVIVRYNQQHLYVLNKYKNIIAKYNYSNKKKNTRHRIWYVPEKIKTKYRGFEDSLEYYQMPKWLKIIYHYVYQRNPIQFASFIEQARNRPKDFLKKALRRNNVTIYQLTESLLVKELNR